MDLHYYSMEHSQLCHLSLSPTSNESGYWCVGDYNCFGRDQIESAEEQPVIRVVRRRNTANKKERRRTQSINNAFAELRECIPNVPPDTKLSKIKTLRLATSYICYLMSVLENEDYGEGFKADLGPQHRKITHQALQIYSEEENGRKLKGRTGWPQHVWALELKQENTL